MLQHMTQMLKTTFLGKPLGKVTECHLTLCPRMVKQQALIIKGSAPTHIITGIIGRVGFAKMLTCSFNIIS